MPAPSTTHSIGELVAFSRLDDMHLGPLAAAIRPQRAPVACLGTITTQTGGPNFPQPPRPTDDPKRPMEHAEPGDRNGLPSHSTMQRVSAGRLTRPAG